jgi:NADPH2:quinone reductase
VRAWQVHEHGDPLEVLRLGEIDEPTPAAGEIRLRVLAAAIGMPDVFMCRNQYAFKPPVPFVPGQEVCGVVDAVGDGVEVPVGTRLMAVTNFYDGRGGFAEKTIVRAESAYRVPERMSAVDAASFRIGFSTAWMGLVRRGGLAAGEFLVVLGAAGGSGATAVQLGHALGAKVIAVAASPEKLEFCRRLGADVLIDRKMQPVPEAILAATDARGAEVIYDPVGGELGEQSLKALAPFGRFLAIGFASGRWPQFDTHDFVWRNQSMVGVIAGGVSREEGEADHEAMLELADQGRLDSFAVTADFADLPGAVQAVASGSVIGKYVVTVATG